MVNINMLTGFEVTVTVSLAVTEHTLYRLNMITFHIFRIHILLT